MAKKCAFCGIEVRHQSTARTRAREHVFPRWALEEFNLSKAEIEFTEINTMNGSLHLSKLPPIRKFDLDSFLLGNVCSNCNNGWMSNLESESKPALREFIAGRSDAISNDRIVAKWALKTAYSLTAYLNNKNGGVHVRHGREICGDTLHLPKGVVIFSSRAAEWKIQFSLTVPAMIDGVDHNLIAEQWAKSYQVFFQFGHAYFLVRYHPDNRAIVKYHPELSKIVQTSMRCEPDYSLNPGMAGVEDPDFIFVMSHKMVSYQYEPGEIRRNDLCHCGSGVKFKYCHGAIPRLRKAPLIRRTAKLRYFQVDS
ncbi:MAG: SEC-C domain-containing protein [Proteobacteria bacterium]|nr:SEC-C domain-containing protein [Pseudomonadota bacterium]